MRRIAAILVALLGLSTIVAVSAPAAAATTDLVINEVESDGDTTDWIELYNPTGAAIDASGLRVTDDNPSRTFTIASGSIVPALGFLAVDVSVGSGSFGLGNGDQVHVWDGVTEIDSFTYASHAAVTWGACPDGSGVFVDTLVATKGAANACDAEPADYIVINEVESSGGTPGDWVELHNTASVQIDISGLVIKDNDDSHAWTIPAGTVIAAGGFAAFDVETGSSGFGLGGNDSARLFDGEVLVDSYSWTAHAATTYGRCPDGSGDFALTVEPTKAASNDCALPEGADEISINELQSDDPVAADWVELYNSGDTPMDLSGWVVADNGTTSVLPAAAVVPANGFLVLEQDTHFSFGLGNGDEFHLYLADGVTVVDEISYPSHPTAPGTWGRCPDGEGDIVLTAEATRGALNACAVDPAEALVINEIESNGDTTDWVELYNTASIPVDASGLLLKDSGEGNTITVPAASVIAPGGYLAVDVTGLGGADSARLMTADGTTLIDSYSWTAHADETFGRCPNGSGDFVDTDAATKGAPNDCPAPAGFDNIVINEVESSGGTPADWVEFYNTGDTAVDLSAWIIHDSEDDHTFVIPAGTTIEPLGFAVAVVDVPGGFGLGNNDRVRLYLPDNTTLVDERIWGPDHSPTTFGLCPDGTGEFIQTFSSTKGAPNDCSPVRINEVESSGGTPGDWVELVNAGDAAVDISGWIVKDNDDTHAVTIPAGTTLAAGAYYVVDTEPAFGLGGADSARLYDAASVLLDAYSWTEHAATSYARCPDGTGLFETSASPTRGALNDCAGIVPSSPWPGGPDVTVVSEQNFFGQDMSGLAYEGTGTETRGTLWAVNNGSGTLFKLQWNGTAWVPAASDWAAGKALRYPDGTGQPDAEGVGFAAAGSVDGIYVATERNGAASGVSRPSVLRFDVSDPGSTLTATHEWNLTGILPPMGNNTGLEGVTWVPDAFLTSRGMIDESTGLAYNPADYPAHGSGLFFVAVEATGDVYAVALETTGEATLIATIDPGLTIAAEVTFDASTGLLWAVCDEACQGKTVTLEIAQDGAFDGKFQISNVYENPEGMLDSIANEGFAIAPQELCIDNAKPVFYADDAETAGYALREATLDCVSDVDPVDPTDPTDPSGPAAPSESDLTPETQGGISGPKSAVQGSAIVVTVGQSWAGETVDGWLFSEPTHLGTRTVSESGVISVAIPLDATVGAHRLAVTDENGDVIGWYGIQVTAAVLASTGSTLPPIAPVAAVLLLLGVVALATRRVSAN
ncbi:hypothetical protein M2152_000047 [Microbacteriaceae bacterium SG_E_30_P1]|uniref:LTD domain-containing protein n=1 Tax=Antiquaquibacter oligotrophicus TaxID=2880260 RepID=A0ABT6KIU2_9MICO|nr:lamin tail domain-containing protein [Antiquaquibacter oligotrophicus]MDH6179865.1 hypothetical protein [Antiquaquibacter oligotrophicus]UDF14374.1 lamin tail domain-containing protein [Antiquaquibacter oligotrophicus]